MRATVTKNKNKVQRRVLTKSLNELHSQFKSEMGQHLAMSYRQFTRRRPFYITEPKTRDRETCACAEHENIRLLISKLHTRGLLQTTSLSQILRSIVCEPKNKDCMDRICLDCCFEEVKFPETDFLAEVSWEQWERVTSNNGEKTFANVVKKTYSETVQELKYVFQKKIEAIAIHQFNWVHQTEQFRALKERLTETEAVLHVDFSSNTPKAPGLEDLSGKFVIITYDERPYVDQVLKVVGEDVQVSSMRQSDEKKRFHVATDCDIIFYNKKDVQAVISEPEPANSRYSQLSIQDWATFRTAWG